MPGTTTIVLGGGVAGIVAANELRRRLPYSDRIVLVEKKRDHAFAPSFLWVMTGDRHPDTIVTPVERLVRVGVDLIQAEATSLDVTNRHVVTSQGPLAYDYLVIALGAELAPELIPGLKQCAYSFYAFEEAQRLHQGLAQFAGGSIALVVSAVPYKCPGAPHEGAMLILDYFRRRGIRGQVDLHLFTPEPQPMPVAGTALGDSVRQMLASKGISFHPLHKLLSVNPKDQELLFVGKEPVRFDLLVAIPPHRAPSVVREAGLTNDAGWIPVDRFTLNTVHEHVYAIGDITAISIPGRWTPDVPMMLPKAGVFAHLQAEIVAERIAGEINNRPSMAHFCGTGYCMLEAGEGLAGFAYGDFFGEPSPRLMLRNVGRAWHWGKVLFEKWWLSPFGIRKHVLRTLLVIGAKALKIPIKV